MPFLDDIPKAILLFLPRGGSVTVRAVTYNLHLTEEEVHLGLQALIRHSLVSQVRHETFYLTEQGASFRARRVVATMSSEA